MRIRASGTMSLQFRGQEFDIVDAIVDEECLTVAVDFAHEAVADEFFVETCDTGFHCQAIFRRRFQIGNIAKA